MCQEGTILLIEAGDKRLTLKNESELELTEN